MALSALSFTTFVFDTAVLSSPYEGSSLHSVGSLAKKFCARSSHLWKDVKDYYYYWTKRLWWHAVKDCEDTEQFRKCVRRCSGPETVRHGQNYRTGKLLANSSVFKFLLNVASDGDEVTEEGKPIPVVTGFDVANVVTTSPNQPPESLSLIFCCGHIVAFSRIVVISFFGSRVTSYLTTESWGLQLAQCLTTLQGISVCAVSNLCPVSFGLPATLHHNTDHLLSSTHTCRELVDHIRHSVVNFH